MMMLKWKVPGAGQPILGRPDAVQPRTPKEFDYAPMVIETGYCGASPEGRK
jgi:hypothetical protein